MNGNVSGEGSPPMPAHPNHGPSGEQGHACFPATAAMGITISSSWNDGLVNYVEDEDTHESLRTPREESPLEPHDSDTDIHWSHLSALWSPSERLPQVPSQGEYDEDNGIIIPDEGDGCGEASISGRDDAIHVGNSVGFDVASNERVIPSSPLMNSRLVPYHFDEPREAVPFEDGEMEEEKGEGDNQEARDSRITTANTASDE